MTSPQTYIRQLLCALLLLIGVSQVQAQTGASSMVFRFTRQVWLNPTIILAKQNFEQSTNVKLLILPRLNANDSSGNSRIEKAFDKLLSFLVYKDNVQGSIKFYFNPKNPAKPFSFGVSDELHCKFTPLQKDSVESILNQGIVNSNNLDNFTALPFDSLVTRASRYCKKVLFAKPGACGPNPDNEFTLAKINSTPAKLDIERATQTELAGNGGVDKLRYAELAQYYNAVTDVADNSTYNIAWKAFEANKSDKVKIKLQKKQPGFDITKLTFKNAQGTTTYNANPLNTSDSSITFNISGHSPGSMAEIVAYYTPTTTPTQTFAIGAFNAQFYEAKTYKVVLVNLGGATMPNENAVRDTLNKIYGNVFITWQVSTASSTLPGSVSKSIHVESSGLLSNYMPDMQPIVSHFKDHCSAYHGNDEDTYYLLFGATNDGNLDGYMPRARNTGFIFSTSLRTIAHELGHGAFNLKHIFSSEELGEGAKGSTGNLMDYASGNRFYKHQWELIHDPAFVSWFGGDDEDGAVEKDKNYFTPAGLPFHCVETLNTIIYADSIVKGAFHNGIVYGFMKNDVIYESKILNNKFYGYFKRGTGEIYNDGTNFSNGQQIDVITYHYLGGCQVQKYQRSYTCPQAIGSMTSVYAGGLPLVSSFQSNTGEYYHEQTTITGCTVGGEGANGLGQDANAVTKNYDHPSIALVPINFASQSCNTFALANGNIAHFTSEQQANISKLGLAEDGELIAFQTNDGKIYYNTYSVKVTNGQIEKKYGSTYFTCFDCLEVTDLTALSSPIIRTQENGKIFYKNLLPNSSFYIRIDESNIEPLDDTKQVLYVNNGTFSCGKAALTTAYIENGIWDCSMTSACLYKYLRYVDKTMFKAFRRGTRERILDFLFTNSWVEHPGGSDEYAWLNYRNKDTNYILLEAMEAMKDLGEIDWFVDEYLMSRTGSQPINLAKLIHGNSDPNMRLMAISVVCAQINGKEYTSPSTSFAVPNKDNLPNIPAVLSIPNNMNGLIIYYENMVQAVNSFTVPNSKFELKVNADEFDYEFSGTNVRITQEGSFFFYKKGTSTEDFSNLKMVSSYNDDYLVHPYSQVPVTFGKAFNELQIDLGAQGKMPVCMAALLAQLGQEKASHQNMLIVGGALAVVSAAFTGGASIAAMASGGVTFGGITTVVVSAASFYANTSALYNDVTEGTATLTPEEVRANESMRKVAGYLSLAEGGLGILSMAKGSFAEMRAYQAINASINSTIDFVSPYISSLFRCLQFRKVLTNTYFYIVLNTANIAPMMAKSTLVTNVAQEVVVFESAASLTAGSGLNTFMMKGATEVEAMVNAGSAFKISNVNIKSVKAGQTLETLPSNQTMIDAAFNAPGQTGSLIITKFQDYSVVFNMLQQGIKPIAYDAQGNSYKPQDDGGNPNNCTTCTTYSNNAICMQFTTLSNNVGATEQGLVTKLCRDRLMGVLPALQTVNAPGVLNYFNAPNPNATTIRRKWNYDLAQGTNNNYLGYNIKQIDGGLIEAWNLMNEAKSPGATSNSGFRYDYEGLKELKNLLANQTASTTLGATEGIKLILEKNERLGCNTCTGTTATYLNKMDEYLKDVTYFAVNFGNKTGASDVMNGAGIKSGQKWHVEGAAFMLRVIRNMQLGTGDITSFETKYADNDEAESPNEREVDIVTSQGKLIECKSWAANGRSFQQFILRQGSSYGQFTEYLQNISSLNQLEYWFDERKATEIQVKQKFQAIFRILDTDNIPIIYKLKPTLFNIGGILNAADFIAIVNSANLNHPIYGFIKVK